ncbi:cytochrome c-type heme lyase-like [Drosophila miranda]|uniref:cytochrome c-type heme lyase-like n=1 Tax=Drosophila miranda TaxID=7229 RepID=UPI0007E6AF29|nr:cytochrome c-type heme lyase-like [Drosophila miranda]
MGNNISSNAGPAGGSPPPEPLMQQQQHGDGNKSSSSPKEPGKVWNWKNVNVKQTNIGDAARIRKENTEEAWQKVLKWEALRGNKSGDLRLKSFVGKENDLSPRARIRSWFGYELPFDRHDWIVDRCGKKEVRYVIDYYHGKVDVRPAMDSAANAWVRMRATCKRWKSDLIEILNASD